MAGETWTAGIASLRSWWLSQELVRRQKPRWCLCGVKKGFSKGMAGIWFLGKRQHRLFEDLTDKSMTVAWEENAEAAGRSQVRRKLLACTGITRLHTKCNGRSFEVVFLFCPVCLTGRHSRLCTENPPSDSIVTEKGQESSWGAGPGRGVQGEQRLKSAPKESRGRTWEPRSQRETGSGRNSSCDDRLRLFDTLQGGSRLALDGQGYPGVLNHGRLCWPHLPHSDSRLRNTFNSLP